MKTITKFLLISSFLVTGVGGVNSVKAEKARLYSSSITVINSGCSYNTETHIFSWNGNGNNTARLLQFNAGLLAKFSKLHITCDNTNGGSFRILIGADGSWKQFYYSAESNTIDITLSEQLTEDQLLAAEEIRIGGNSSVSSQQTEAGITQLEMELLPSNIYLETTWDTPMSIATSADWEEFSTLVAAGVSPLNAQLTADVDAGSTMVGSSEHQYCGTFNGNGHKLTVAYTSTNPCAAPFSYVSNATIQNLKVDGTISSSSTLIGGVVGQMGGTTTIDNCQSSVDITSTYASGDCNCGGIAGINIANSTITVTNCLFDGTITANGANAYCGIIGYLRNGTLTVNNNLVLGTLTDAYAGSTDNHMNNIYRTYASVTNSNNYYMNKFGTASDGIQVSNEQIASGEVAYNLQGEQATQYWGQDLKAASSNPMLTDNVAYKVFGLGGGEYTNWTNTISNDADWVTFSKLVANGSTSLNVTMTADVNAGSTMVGSEGHKYSGTFNGAGHTLTFIYDGDASMIAPFKEVDGATIKDLKTTGSITSSSNLLAGIVGQVNGATTLTRCASDMSITTTVNDNGRIGGLVARNGQSGASLTFNNCMYDGEINSSTNQAAGFVGYSPNPTTISNCLVASTSITGGESNFTPNSITIPDGKYAYYLTKFGTSNQGTQLNKQLLTSGQAAWELNQGIGDGAWFFGQGNLNTSMVDACPALTTDNAKKVVRTQAQYTSTKLYVNPGGAIPNAVRLKALGWYIGDTESDVLTSIPADFEGGDDAIKRTKNYFKLKVGSAGATTLMVPFTTTSLPENVKAYNLTFDETEVTATKVDVITANMPVLINAPAGEYLFSADATGMNDIVLETGDNAWIVYGASTYINGALTGVYNEAGSSSASDPFSYVPANAYVLQNGEEGLGFYKVASANTIKITSFRAYLTAQSNASRISIVFENESAGIEGIAEQRMESESVFDLQGRRVAKPTKGLYIVGGKKVIK